MDMDRFFDFDKPLDGPYQFCEEKKEVTLPPGKPDIQVKSFDFFKVFLKPRTK
jgi:hypothetical protein